MAKRKKRRSTRAQKKQDYPGWAWMIFGLAIGLSVAFAVYVKDRGPASIEPAPEPASLQSSLDDNNEPAAPPAAEPAEPKERRFTFYELLPAFEMEVRDASPEIEADLAPQAVIDDLAQQFNLVALDSVYVDMADLDVHRFAIPDQRVPAAARRRRKARGQRDI